MTVSPRAFLEVAKTLLDNHDEIYFRSATNRAYYGAFHACKNFVASSPVQPTGRGSHQKLINALHHHPLIKDMLFEIKTLRQTADYTIIGYFSEYHARRAVLLSETIIDKIEQILTIH